MMNNNAKGQLAHFTEIVVVNPAIMVTI